VSSITLLSDAPNCGVTYDHHYYDRNSFIVQAIVENDREKKISLGEFLKHSNETVDEKAS
jgi:hypothetical protein